MSEKRQGYIASIFSKDKNPKSKKSLLRNISNIRYKYMLFKAKDDGVYRNISNSFDYIKHTNSCFFHVLNPDVGRVLYDVLNSNEINMDTIPEELNTMSFIAVKKLKRVVFISFEVDMFSCIISSNDFDKKKILNNIHNIFSWMTENLSTEMVKFNIDFEKFFEKFLYWEKPFLDSLIASVYVSEQAYDFTFEKLESVIKNLFNLCGTFNTICVEKMRNCLSKNDIPFYNLLKKGVYVKALDEGFFFNLPYYLMVNVFKYVLKPTSFSDLMDFFKRDSLEEENSENVIFDKELFDNEISLIAENTSFDIYMNNSKDAYNAVFMKIKDEAEFAQIYESVKNLIHEGLLRDVFHIKSEKDGSNYLVRYNDNSKTLTLSQYIKRYRNIERKITAFISLVNDWCFDTAISKNKVYVKSGVSLLDIISINEEDNTLYFTSLENICFSKNEGYETFEHSLCIMQGAARYAELKQITGDDIYKCEFAKLFSSSFVQAIISYIDNKEYDSKGLNKVLKNSFRPDDISKIEFLENISTIDMDMLQRISFCKNADGMELVKSIKAVKQAALNAKSTEHISLDDKINFVEGNDNLTLSKKLLDKLTCSDTSSNFFMPEKVIISKDVFDSQNYIVVGVVWNRSRLYTLDSLVKAKHINTANIYNTVIKRIIRLYKNGYYVDRLKTGIGSLLLDDKCNIYIDITSCNSYKDICHNNPKGLKLYYTSIVRQIVNRFADFLSNFRFFTYDTLIEECDDDENDFEDVLDKIEFCSEHQKLYLSSAMCEECQKVYTVVSALGSVENTEELGKGIFYEVDDMYGWIWKPQIQAKRALEYIADRVKIGILNGLYDKFVGLVPEKIIINNGSKNRKVLGIWYDDYEYDEAYIARLDSFKHAQRLKVILMLYKKILPYIYDYSFIVPNKQVFSSMFIDREYKGEFIIPDLIFIKCEVTVSEDEALKEQERNKTLKLFSEFLYEYITSDEGLMLEIQNNDIHISKIVEDILACTFTEDHIRSYLKNKDAYCKVHGVYFSSSDKFCPECIASGISKKNAVVLDKQTFDDMDTNDCEYEGGEATLYTTLDGKIQKIFNNTVNTSFKTKVIGKAFEKAKLFKEFNKSHEDIEFVLIDKVLYSFDNGVLNLEGYTQKFIDGSFKISSLKEKAFVQSKGYTKKDILEILIKVSKAIEFLHSIGVFIGDLNGGNILIKDKKVYIIDMDGMSYDDVRNCVYTDTYIYPPSAENKNITELDDWYSLAIQAFYYLTYSHPFRGICEDDKIPKNEVERMKYGYSVLGNHGIKQPAVSDGVGLIPKYLIKFFLETFEGNKRESMTEVLGKYLESVQKSSMEFKKIERQYAVAQEITEKIYVDMNGQLRYNEEHKCTVEKPSQPYECENCYECVAFLGNKATAVINKKTGALYFFKKVYENIEHAHNNTIYYEGANDYIIYVDELTAEGDIKTYKLQRQTENPVWVMAGNGNNKFVILEENMDENTYDIYCNSSKVCSFSQDAFLAEEAANIIYDEISDKWAVYMSCNGKLKLVVIQKNGTYAQSTLDIEDIPNSASFYKNTIYFAGEGKIFMYNVNSQNISSIDCNIATSESAVERRDNKLIISNEKESYMYVKS